MRLRAGSWIAAGAALLAFGCERGTPEPPEPAPGPDPSPEVVEETVIVEPEPTPRPLPSIGRRSVDVARFYNGIVIESEFIPKQGDELASKDRRENDAYVLEMTLRVRVPRPSSTIGDLAENDPKLPHLLNDMELIMETARVSPSFERLYENKVEYNRPRLGRLDSLLSRHNFFDCETILELEHPLTGRRALLLKGDMDVNTDGSDGDRNAPVDDSSPFWQPQTSYRWPKQTDRPNPFLEPTRERLAELEEEFAEPGLSDERNRQLRSAIDHAQRTILELQRWSFLVSKTDPFIVLPTFMLRAEDGPFRPRLGDYAIVIYQGQLYPAIVGDAGPSFKVGEASMRLCREIEPQSSAIRRPVSSIDVSYLVFPGSAEEEAGPPDLELWARRCQELLDEFGGSPVELHHWEDLVKPWPTPTPEPPEEEEAPGPEAEIDPDDA